MKAIQLKEIFALEQREIKARGKRGRWRTTSLYSPFDLLVHDYGWCAKKADSAEIVQGMDCGKRYRRFEYRVIRFQRQGGSR
jgi:hypothetical protein